MRRALSQSSLSPSAVDYINAHATSTPLGDAAENTAIKRLMLSSSPDCPNGAGVTNPSQITVSSTKGAIGHLLGAAGAIEALFCVMAIREGVVPPTVNLENLDDGFDCDYVPRNAKRKDVRVAMSNSFGFGGTNASLCFRAID